jgi:hypothetical protein
MGGLIKHNILNEDIMVPTAGQPLIYKKLIVEVQNIFFDEKAYNFSDIKRISFNWIRYKKIGIGDQNIMTLEFDLSGFSKRISLNTNEIFYNAFKSIKKKHVVLYSIYSFLSEKSFSFRLQSYLNDVKFNGYFFIDGCKIFPNGNFEIKNLTLNIYDKNTKLSMTNRAFFMCERKGNNTVLTKIFGSNEKGILIESTIPDFDVFIYIIRNFFKINF